MAAPTTASLPMGEVSTQTRGDLLIRGSTELKSCSIKPVSVEKILAAWVLAPHASTAFMLGLRNLQLYTDELWLSLPCFQSKVLMS